MTSTLKFITGFISFKILISVIHAVEFQASLNPPDEFRSKATLEACVKLCVRVDPSTGKLSFNGGHLDCVDACRQQYMATSPTPLLTMPAAVNTIPAVEYSSSNGNPSAQEVSFLDQEGPAEISTIYSTLMSGWKVLEDLCDIFNRARMFKVPGIRELSDKDIMCNVLEATGQPNFNKATCMTSSKVEDLLRGCKQMTIAKMAHSSDDEMVLKMANLLNEEVVKIKARQHQQKTPSLFQQDAQQCQEAASQRLALCVNEDYLKSKELDTVKALQKDISDKQELIRQLEKKSGCSAAVPEDTTTVGHLEPIIMSSNDLTRSSCLRDLKLLRHTMNRIIASLESKYQVLNQRKCNAGEERELVLKDDGDEGKGTTYLVDNEYYSSAAPQLRGFIQVDPEKKTNATLIIQALVTSTPTQTQ